MSLQNFNMTQWFNRLSSVEYAELQSAMKAQYDARIFGETVYPEQNDIFRAFEYFPPELTKVVIIGQDPYHQPHQAMGLSFSVYEDCQIPPSLRNIYEELCLEYGGEAPETGNLTRWAEQGVLLLNASLTVERGKPNSHQKIWENATGAFVRICTELPQPVVFMLWGSFAKQMFENKCSSDKARLKNKYVCESTHPSPFSARTPSTRCPAFIGSNCFKNANEFLINHNITPIQWK